METDGNSGNKNAKPLISFTEHGNKIGNKTTQVSMFPCSPLLRAETGNKTCSSFKDCLSMQEAETNPEPWV
jgi:hypothetical protein